MHLVHHKTDARWGQRLRAAGIHLGISLAIAFLAALLVFFLWYPHPYREISGGRELFLIVVAVDVVLGPMITLAVFNTSKSRRELTLDLSLVGLIQLAALGYGLWTVAMARPVHLVFEFDRLRVVHRIEIVDELLPKAPAGLAVLPLGRPSLLAVRPFRNGDERIEATMAALQGVSLSSRPDLWESYEEAKPRVLKSAKPVIQLKNRFPASAVEIDTALAAAGLRPQSALYLPMAGRKIFWTAFLDPETADVVAFVPLDSF
jgi:hypothetical protein